MEYALSSDEYRQLKEILPFLLDEETGIIESLEEMPRQTDMPDIFYYKALVANTGAISNLPNELPITAGTSLNKDRAMAKAIGEAIERYCAAIYSRDNMTWGCYSELKKKAVHPAQLRLFTSEQLDSKGFTLKGFTTETPVWWTMAQQLKNGTEILIPAGFIYCPYFFDKNQGEFAICEMMSTGLASHISFQAAALNGILEVIERDNFMLTWCFKIAHPQIALDSLTDSHLNLLNAFRKQGYSIKVLHAKFETGVSTIICVMKGNNSANVPFIVSCATHLNPVHGITKCLEELALMERFCKRAMISSSFLKSTPANEKVSSLVDHIYYWLNPDRLDHANFLISSKKEVALKDLANHEQGDVQLDLKELSNRIHRCGFDLYASDITTEDIESLGLKVVRILIPDLMPLNTSHRNLALGSNRFTSFRNKMNVDSSTLINTFPHPFA
jgi:ribosomal protein S12 methylthiotransferase accessory factor